MTIGQVTDSAVTIRYSIDERVEDGLYCARALQLLQQRVEEPASHIAE